MKRLPALALLLVVAGELSLAEERLIIDVSGAGSGDSSSNVVYYRGDWSVRHSEQRTYGEAAGRRRVGAAQARSSSPAGARRAGEAGGRPTGQASRRTAGQATARHGSVRLDTVR